MLLLKKLKVKLILKKYTLILIANKEVKDVIDEVWNQETGLDSCVRVGMEIKEKFGESLPLAERTTYNYTRKGRNELYGKPFLDAGTLGKCSYIWCKKEGEGVTAYKLW